MSVVLPDPLESEIDAPLSPLATLCRRISVLRAKGRSVEAGQLQTRELGRLVAEIRAQHGEDALPEERLRAIFAREQARVADAGVLAELLSQSILVAPNAPAPVNAGATAPAPSGLPANSPSLRAKPTAPPAIADLLDDMLAQDAEARRKRTRAA